MPQKNLGLIGTAVTLILMGTPLVISGVAIPPAVIGLAAIVSGVLLLLAM